MSEQEQGVSTDHPWAGDDDGHNCATCIELDDHFNKCDRLAHVIAGVMQEKAEAENEAMTKRLRTTGSIAGPGFRLWTGSKPPEAP